MRLYANWRLLAGRAVALLGHGANTTWAPPWFFELTQNSEREFAFAHVQAHLRLKTRVPAMVFYEETAIALAIARVHTGLDLDSE